MSVVPVEPLRSFNKYKKSRHRLILSVSVGKLGWTVSEVQRLLEPDEETQLRRHKAGMLALSLVDHLQDSNPCHTRTGGKPASVRGKPRSSADPGTRCSRSTSEVHGQKKLFKLSSEWNWQLHERIGEEIKRREHGAHSEIPGEENTSPAFEVWASSRTPDGDWRPEARIPDSLTNAICHVNMFHHQPLSTDHWTL